MACPIWRRLLPHLTRFALSRAFDSDGRRIEISKAMIPMTTSSSTSVNARRERQVRIGSDEKTRVGLKSAIEASAGILKRGEVGVDLDVSAIDWIIACI